MSVKLTDENDLNPCGCRSSEIGPNHDTMKCAAEKAKPVELMEAARVHDESHES